MEFSSDTSEGPIVNAQWVHDTPINSDVEAKLRQLLIQLGNADQIVGIQVCAYKDGQVIIDTAAGTLGRYDLRPVQRDSLFNVFSVTKGITAGLVNWLVDKGKLKLDDRVADIWPGFGANGKDQIKVHHVLNHTSGLHNVLGSITRENPSLLSDWDECLNQVAKSIPETQPGHEQLYHYLSFGWLCGGIIEHASGKKFQEILEEAFVHPLNIEGELYIGIPPGVESRLATLTAFMGDISRVSGNNRKDLPSGFRLHVMAEFTRTFPALFNELNTRCAIIPAANAHCSARALARYYAALVDGGAIPPRHSSSSTPPLGNHPHIPKYSFHGNTEKQISFDGLVTGTNRIGSSQRKEKSDSSPDGNYGSNSDGVYTGIPSEDSCSSGISGTSEGVYIGRKNTGKLFNNPRICDQFLGVGEYENLVHPNGQFGLGFKRSYSREGELIGFGHAGLGGSTGYCDINNRFAIAVTLNQMSLGAVTAKIIQLVCSELHIPVPEDVAERALDDQFNWERPQIN